MVSLGIYVRPSVRSRKPILVGGGGVIHIAHIHSSGTVDVPFGGFDPPPVPIKSDCLRKSTKSTWHQPAVCSRVNMLEPRVSRVVSGG